MGVAILEYFASLAETTALADLSITWHSTIRVGCRGILHRAAAKCLVLFCLSLSVSAMLQKVEVDNLDWITRFGNFQGRDLPREFLPI